MKATKAQAAEVAALFQRICPLLAGHSPEVQGAALADLLALFLAGYQGPGAAEVREELLALHVETVRGLIPANEAMLREWGEL
jgi:hypothetical protein